MVEPVLHSENQARLDRAIDEPDGTVVSQQERRSHVADGRSAPVIVTADGEQQLMLGGRDPEGLGLLLTPPEEPPELGTELEETPIVGVLERISRHS